MQVNRVHFKISYLVDEARFSDVRESTNDDSPGIWIDGRQTAQMLTNLFQISQTLTLSLHDGNHSTQSSFFELFATVKGVTILEKADIIFSDIVNKMSEKVKHKSVRKLIEATNKLRSLLLNPNERKE